MSRQIGTYSPDDGAGNAFGPFGAGVFYAIGKTGRWQALLVVLLCCSFFRAHADQPATVRGVLDLRKTDLSKEVVELNGEWKWYWHQLRDPNQPDAGFEFIQFPALWEGTTWQRKPVSAQGYATYSLTVLLPAHSSGLALELPDQYSAYRLFVNGKEFAQDGTPATTLAETQPYWSTQLVELPASGDTLRLLMQLANFHHAKGGTSQAIRLGERTRLDAILTMDRALDLFLTGCLFMSGLFFLGLFSFSRTDRAILFYGLFCLVYCYRIVGTHPYVLHTILPDLSWQLTIRLEYLSLYVGVAIFVLYTHSLYSQDTDRRVSAIMTWLCVGFAGTVLLLPTVLFTKLMNPFLALMVCYIGYAFYVYWLAAKRRRPGARFSLMSTALLMVVFGFIILEYFGIAMPAKALLFTGYLGFFFLQSLVLAYRFSFALSEARHTEKQFLANMSHEIRTPLNAIIGFSNLLDTNALTGQQQEFVRYIHTAGKNLLTIVNDILDIAKIEAGKLRLETIPFSIQSLSDSIRTMLLPTAVDKDLQLVVDVDPNLPPVLMGDPTRLTQILLNLLSNAIKFTKQGRVSLRVEQREITGGFVRVRFVVQDTGIGIDSGALPYIFERFRQASDSTTRFYGGTGLGLSIVKSLVELQGGWIRVTSTPGEGSWFTLEIPYKIAKGESDQLINKSISNWKQTGQTLRILVVEDNPMNQKLALSVLSRLGHSAQVAENGELALEWLQRSTFDLILMDIQMPIMDGYTTTRHIRNTLHNKTPIIAMTAHALASEREQCLQAGMNDFLSKPFMPNDLQQLIRKYVPNGPAEEIAVEPETAPAADATSFTMEPLLEVVEGDLFLATQLLELFLSQTVEQMQQIRQALAADDLEIVGQLLHSQKAPIKMLGLDKVCLQLEEIESLIVARAAPTVIVPLVYNYILALEAELPGIESVLRSTLQNMPSE
ncbi:multi-sensor hybrid histidine kinase [Fibrisoma limi BUZ 3]|uniref:histidine kinase n=1 Tax=Fibrisoma limi BUZ 3 TaxID=1185876 RepID=I2GQN3_9BACT|nr:response regulator [Fibrisoma limi]CCH56211.1 multi-sensor hybrid histidine kinase [Fibrisoma limi BUZ 3]